MRIIKNDSDLIVQNMLDEIDSYAHIYFYGAQHFAKSMFLALRMAGGKFTPDAFLVTDVNENPAEVDGILVISPEEETLIKDHSLVIVAMNEKYYQEVANTLAVNGFKHVFRLFFGSREDQALRKVFFKQYFEKKGMEFICTYGEYSDNTDLLKEKLALHTITSHHDNSLKNPREEKEYSILVQAGSAMTEKQLSSFRDNTGKQISMKNRNYCECTAIYWISQNHMAQKPYVGFQHYRRRFVIDDMVVKWLAEEAADVVLPVPVITLDNEYRIHYEPYIKQEDFRCLLEILQEYEPEYYKTACEVICGNIFYPCNMFIMKNSILETYTDWLFRLLFLIEGIRGDETKRYDRYLGYIAEHLTTIYFVHRQRELKIVHCDMEILT